MDGEADASAAAGMLRAWRDDAAGRAAWHAYHLIGDVLRSEDLRSAPRRDAAFLAALRARLDAEPALLAPAAVDAPRGAAAAPRAGAPSAHRRPSPRLRRRRRCGARAALAAGDRTCDSDAAPPRRSSSRAIAPSTQAPLAAVADGADRAAERADDSRCAPASSISPRTSSSAAARRSACRPASCAAPPSTSRCADRC